MNKADKSVKKNWQNFWSVLQGYQRSGALDRFAFLSSDFSFSLQKLDSLLDSLTSINRNHP